MRAKLHQISKIRTGYTFRRPEGVQRRCYAVVQIGDVSAGQPVTAVNLKTAELAEIPENFLLRRGDILFCARGTRNIAAVFASDAPFVVAGTQFFTIKVRGDDVLPEFVAWHINQRESQLYLQSCMHGSRVGMIHKQALEDLLMPVPPIRAQKQVLALYELAMREQGLMESIKTKRWDLVSLLCSQAAEDTR